MKENKKFVVKHQSISLIFWRLNDNTNNEEESERVDKKRSKEVEVDIACAYGQQLIECNVSIVNTDKT